MNRPTQAFVLAAGFGTRMLPLSRDLPKPMMPLWGRPILEHVLRLLRRWGVKDVLINCHHEPGAILEFVRHYPVPGLQIDLSHEPEILGTGGALRRAQWFLDDRPFWLVNADIAADLDPDLLLRSFRKENPLAALWLHAALGPRTVEMRNGLVRSFESGKPGAEGTFTFCGLHLISPRVLRYLPESGFANIIGAYQRAMKRRERIAGVCVPDSYWADLGTPEQYLDAHREIRIRHRRGLRGGSLFDPLTGNAALARRAGARIRGFVALGNDVHVGRNTHIEDSVIWDGARIEAGSRVQQAIVGRQADVSGLVSGVAMRADRSLDVAEAKALRNFGWAVESATVLPLGPRGSARTFSRIVTHHKSLILMRYGLEREENRLYCSHARFLKKIGMRIPTILYSLPRERLAFVEDIGDASLLELVRTASANKTRNLYRDILDQVIRLHTRGTQAARRAHLRLMPPFSPALYRWERDLFADKFLAGKMGRPAPAIRAAQRDLARVALRLQMAPKVLIHRDLQSSNICWFDKKTVFIDFQGMRFGPAVYDLASLLCDPYVMLPEGLQTELIDYYAGHTPNPKMTKQLFWWAAVERLAQALGAYARLSRLPGMQSFETHISPALLMLQRALSHVEGLRSLKSLFDQLASESDIPALKSGELH